MKSIIKPLNQCTNILNLSVTCLLLQMVDSNINRLFIHSSCLKSKHVYHIISLITERMTQANF